MATAVLFIVLVASPPPSPGGTRVTACGVLSQANTTYLLQNDVSSEATCFTISANDVTLDLNGHKITYGSGGAPSYGVISSANHVTVMNGAITQATGAAPFSHGVEIGIDGMGSANLVLHHLTITVSSASSHAIHYYPSAPGGANIYRNMLRSNVTVIRNRHQLEGYVIKLDDGGATAPSNIHDNVIIGGAQGGISFLAPGSRVYSNDISQTGTYSNDFCIAASGLYSEVYANNCHPKQGRGIHVDRSDVSVHDNTIDVIEFPNNLEYGGCQLGGTYGIRIEQWGGGLGSISNVQVFNNNVTARSTVCEAHALRVTFNSVLGGNGNRVYNNTFVARRAPGSTASRVSGVAFAGVDGQISLDHNLFTSDAIGVYVSWDGMRNIPLTNNTFVRGSNPDPNWELVHFENGCCVPATGNVFQDSIFQNGAGDAVSSSMSSSAPPQEYILRWTLTLIVMGAAGAPLSSAIVAITDATGAGVFSGVTDASGRVSAVLSQYRRYNTTSANSVTQNFTPHTVNVSRTGFITRIVSVTADRTKSQIIQLTP